MRKITFFILTIFTVATLFAAARPSLDGRAVVADEGSMPRGLFARTVGYLPGDSVTVTNPATGSTVDVLILGAIDPSEGVAILLSQEAADVLRIKKNSSVQVKITKRTGSFDENASGSAVLSNDDEPEITEALTAPKNIEKKAAVPETVQEPEEKKADEIPSENENVILIEEKPAAVEKNIEEVPAPVKEEAVEEPAEIPEEVTFEEAEVEETVAEPEAVESEELDSPVEEAAEIEEPAVEENAEIEEPFEDVVEEEAFVEEIASIEESEDEEPAEPEVPAESIEDVSEELEAEIEEEPEYDEPEISEEPSEPEYDEPAEAEEFEAAGSVIEELPGPAEDKKSDGPWQQVILVEPEKAPEEPQEELPPVEEELPPAADDYEVPAVEEVSVEAEEVAEVAEDTPETEDLPSEEIEEAAETSEEVEEEPAVEEELPAEESVEEESVDEQAPELEEEPETESVDEQAPELEEDDVEAESVEEEAPAIEEEAAPESVEEEAPAIEEDEAAVEPEASEEIESEIPEIAAEPEVEVESELEAEAETESETELAVEEESVEIVEAVADEYKPIILVPAEMNPPVAEEKSEPAEVIAPQPVVEEAPVTESVPVENVRAAAPKIVVSDNWRDHVVSSADKLEKACYYIQIAQFSSEEAISGIIEKYGQKYPVVLVPNARGTAYNIMVGPLSIDEYGSILEKFKAWGFKDAFVKKIR